MQTLRRMSWHKIRSRVIPGLPHLHRSRLRRCRCCGRITLVLAFDSLGEASRCVRCGANFRYELLSEYLSQSGLNLGALDILELDPDSPLRPILSVGKSYLRTFYSADQSLGSVRPDGAQCEDITRLTLPDKSLDLLVSSEVLEHVPDLQQATREIARVLRPGGCHLFTVPTVDHGHTLRRATIEGGTVRHLAPPEYHGDPLGTGGGILAFWTFGRDATEWLSNQELRTNIVSKRSISPGNGLRVIWKSTRL